MWCVEREGASRAYSPPSPPSRSFGALRNLVIATGDPPNSYLDPPESWRGGAAAAAATSTISTAMRYSPARDGDRAGLVAFRTDDYYFFVGVTRADGGPVVQVVQVAQRAGARAARRDVDATTLSTKVAGGFVGTMVGMYAYTATR